MYVQKNRRVSGRKSRSTGLSLWDPRIAGATMPEPVINHGYFVGTSGLGLWDPRIAGATMPEPVVNRAYTVGVITDAARGDYPRLKNPPGISATPPTMAGLGGYGRGCGCGGLSGYASCRCPRCRAGLPCPCCATPVGGLWDSAKNTVSETFNDLWYSTKKGFSAAKDYVTGANQQPVEAQGIASLTFPQFPDPVLKKVSAAPDLDPKTIQPNEVVGLFRNPGQTRISIRVNKGGWDYLVNPNALSPEAFAQVAEGIKVVAARTTPAVLEAEQKRITNARAEIARQNALDAKWQAEFNEKNSLLNLMAREARGLADKAGAAAGLAIPTWAKVAAGVVALGFVANIYLNYLKTKQLMLKSRASADE